MGRHKDKGGFFLKKKMLRIIYILYREGIEVRRGGGE